MRQREMKIRMGGTAANYVFFVAVILSGVVLAAQTIPTLKPGQASTIYFPDLPPTLYETIQKKGTQPAMTVFLPKNYDLQRKYPLIIFIGGGDGGPATGAAIARKLTEEKDFVCVSLPLFREKLDPPPAIILRENDFKFMWPLFKTMLAKLDEMVPNIDPARRIIGGLTAGMIDFVGEEFVGYFSAFVCVEGGFRLQHFERIKGKPLLFLYSDAKDWNLETRLGKPAKAAGVKVTLHKMENVGHAFPETQYPVVRKWLQDMTR